MQKYKGLPQDIYSKVCEYLENLKEKEEITVWINKTETREIRTLAQNSFFYGLFTEIGNFMGETPDNVKQYFLVGCFGSRQIKLSKIKTEVPLKNKTSDLTKEEAIFFIDTLWKFIEIHNIPCKYTPKDLQSLYDTF